MSKGFCVALFKALKGFFWVLSKDSLAKGTNVF